MISVLHIWVSVMIIYISASRQQRNIVQQCTTANMDSVHWTQEILAHLKIFSIHTYYTCLFQINLGNDMIGLGLKTSPS